jgi:hypothetical protein
MIPKISNPRMSKEDEHAPMPRFPDMLVNVSSLIKEKLLGTKVEIAEKHFAFGLR